jgi:hypothetical protein
MNLIIHLRDKDMKTEEAKKFKEALTVADFKRLCESSLPPDVFDMLADHVIPTLTANRHIIDWDLVKVIDCKYWICDTSGDKVRMLTDSECAEYIWGKDTGDYDELRRQTDLLVYGLLQEKRKVSRLSDHLQGCLDAWPTDAGPLGAEKAYCAAENLLKELTPQG